MDYTKIKVSKEEFRRYESVRRSGQFNMITEWTYAADAAGLDRDTYRAICEQYSELRARYITDDE